MLEAFKIFGTLSLNTSEADAKLLESINKAKKAESGFGEAFTAIGAGAEKVGKSLLPITIGIGGIATAMVKTTADFDKGMSEVSAISGATGDDLLKLRDKAKQMGEITKFSATESAEAMKYMAMAGWKTEEMLGGLEGIMNLASASGEDLGTTSDIVTDALTAFGLSASDSTHFADILATASSNANTNVGLMGETFKYVAPVAGALGYSAEDVAHSIGLMANAGIKGSQAGTALRSMFSRLSAPPKECAEAMDALNLSITNSDGKMKTLDEVMGDLRKAFSGMTEDQQAMYAKQIAGQEAMSGLLAIVNASEKDYNKLSDAISNCDGSAKTMSDTMLNNLSGQMTLLKSKLEGIAIQFGEKLMPYVTKAVDKIAELADKFAGLNDEEMNTVIKVGLMVASIPPLLIAFGKITSGIGSIINICTKMSSFMGSIGTATIAPFLAIVAVIGVLIGAFVTLMKTNEEFRAKVFGAINAVKDIFNSFCQGITDRLNAMGFDFENIVDVLKELWQGFCNLLAPIFEYWMTYIVDYIEMVLGVITGLFDVFAGVFTGDWDMVWNGIKEIFGSSWEFMKSTFENFTATFVALSNKFLGLFGTSWDTIWTDISNYFTEVWNNLVAFLQEIWETILGMLQSYIDMWCGIFDFFVALLTENWEGMWNAIGEITNSFVEIINSAFNLLAQFLPNTTEIIRNKLTQIWTNIKTSISTTVNTIFNNVKTVFTNLKTTIIDIWNGIWTGIKGILNMIIEGTENVINRVVDGINKLIDGVNKLIEKVGSVMGLTAKIPKFERISLPRLEQGGVLEKGQLGLLEGNGAEAVVPLDQNDKWIRNVANDMQAKGVGGNAETLDVLNKILSALNTLNDANETMPDNLLDAISNGLKLNIDNREFARLVKAV